VTPEANLWTFQLQNNARQWRTRAEEWRMAANDMSHDSCRQRAYCIADHYDRMARDAEERVIPGQ
jgi:hypothetical protein